MDIEVLLEGMKNSELLNNLRNIIYIYIYIFLFSCLTQPRHRHITFYYLLIKLILLLPKTFSLLPSFAFFVNRDIFFI